MIFKVLFKALNYRRRLKTIANSSRQKNDPLVGWYPKQSPLALFWSGVNEPSHGAPLSLKSVFKRFERVFRRQKASTRICEFRRENVNSKFGCAV